MSKITITNPEQEEAISQLTNTIGVFIRQGVQGGKLPEVLQGINEGIKGLISTNFTPTNGQIEAFVSANNSNVIRPLLSFEREAVTVETPTDRRERSGYTHVTYCFDSFLLLRLSFLLDSDPDVCAMRASVFMLDLDRLSIDNKVIFNSNETTSEDVRYILKNFIKLAVIK